MFRPALNTERKSLYANSAHVDTGTSKAINGTSTDIRGYLGHGLICVSIGKALADTAGQTVKTIATVQTAADTAFASPTTLHTFDTVDSAGKLVDQEIDLQACKRYVRVRFTVAGKLARVPIGAVGIFTDRGY
jgi:hypothetical protein